MDTVRKYADIYRMWLMVCQEVSGQSVVG